MFRDALFLAQSDTTVGFLSKLSEKISLVKKRPKDKSFIITVDTLKSLKEFTRVNQEFKNMVRRAKKTTFIHKNLAIRVVKSEEHLNFMSKIKWAYSSSANLSSKSYNKDFAFAHADVIIEDKRGLYEGVASKIYKIKKNKIKKIR